MAFNNQGNPPPSFESIEHCYTELEDFSCLVSTASFTNGEKEVLKKDDANTLLSIFSDNKTQFYVSVAKDDHGKDICNALEVQYKVDDNQKSFRIILRTDENKFPNPFEATNELNSVSQKREQLLNTLNKKSQERKVAAEEEMQKQEQKSEEIVSNPERTWTEFFRRGFGSLTSSLACIGRSAGEKKKKEELAQKDSPARQAQGNNGSRGGRNSIGG